ncbi:MAG: glycosyltransferase family 2 protein [Bifidobacterium sp.]
MEEHEGFAAAKVKLGDKLRIIQQGNVGGSGGFARGMYEVEHHGESGYALLLDDDTVLEPESVSRAIAFANHCEKPHTGRWQHVVPRVSQTRICGDWLRSSILRPLPGALQ